MATQAPSFHSHSPLGSAHVPRVYAARVLAPVGRVLFALIFLLSTMHLFSSGGVAAAQQHGVPLPAVAVPVAGVLALLGGSSVALGLRARVGAWLLFVFLVPVTLYMHAFWAEPDPMTMQMQQAHFMKNVALIGATLLIAYFGSGPFSLDDAARGPRPR